MTLGRLLGLAGLLLCAPACAVRSVYVLQGYDAKGPAALKRIRVVALVTTEQRDLGAVLSHVATDLVRLHKNYIVYEPSVVDGSAGAWDSACNDAQGVLVVLAQGVHADGDAVALDLSAALYACADKALVWRAEGDQSMASTNEDLQQLRSVYENKLGAAAGRYAAPAFGLLKQLIDSLPNPELTDDELMEKIELGRRGVDPPTARAS